MGIKATCAAIVAALFAFVAAPAAAQEGRWLRAESEHFIFYSEGSERQLREAVTTLETFDAALRRLMRTQGEASPSKLEVYLLRNASSLRATVPGLPRDAAGVYTAQTDLVAAFAVYRDGGGLEAQEVLFHEYAHHFMHAYTSAAFPPWYIEGFAEFVQTIEIRDDLVVVAGYSEARAWSLLDANWIDIEDFLNPTGRDFTRDELAQFYAQSWLASHYLLMDSEHSPGFRAYIEALRQGADPVASFEPAFGYTPREFQSRLRRYASNPIPRGTMAAPEVDVAVSITRLPPSADDLLLLHARARLLPTQTQAAEAAALIDEATARFPNDPFAQRLRARSTIVLRRDPVAARPALEALIAANDADVEAHYLMGLSYLVESAPVRRESAPIAAQGRRHFARAFRLDPNHVPTLFRYASTFHYPGVDMTDAAMDVLLTAYNLAPQVQEIALRTGLALMYEERYEEAVVVLEPLANRPHGDTAQARALLQAARNGQPPPPYTPAAAQ